MLCLAGLVGLFLVLLVLIIAGSVMLGGKSVVMGLPLGHGRASGSFLNELLQLFPYPPRSGSALLAGTLPLKYCAVRFACRVPTWSLPVSGHAACPVTAESGVVDVAGVEVGGGGVCWVGGSGPGRKRIRLNRKPPAHLVGRLGIHSRPRMWKRLRHAGYSVVSSADCNRRRYDQQDERHAPVQRRTGVG